MKFIQTSSGDYINTAHIKRLSWNRGSDRNSKTISFPNVVATMIDGDEDELVFCEIGEDDAAEYYLEHLVAELNAE